MQLNIETLLITGTFIIHKTDYNSEDYMKRKGITLCLIMLFIVAFSTSSVFAASGGLKIVDSYPKHRQENTTKDNMVVKLTFNNPVGAKEYHNKNEKAVKIVGPKGEIIPTRVFYNPKDEKEAMVLADTTKKLNIKDNAKYSLHVSRSFTDNNGNTLDNDNIISFKTINQKRNTTVYMIIMVVMFGAMFFLGHRSMKKQHENDVEEKEIKINPYKEAKRTGKSVEEVMKEIEKEKEKQRVKAEKRAAKRESESIKEEKTKLPVNHYKVKKTKPISEAGGTYKSGHKAKVQAAKEQEEKWARARSKKKRKK